MASNQESYKLNWPEFTANLSENLSELRNAEDFLDVTLSIDEENQLQAHKVVLSASSTYFRALLKKNPAEHPVLVMPAHVKYSDLVSLIEFMYRGEVSVRNADMSSFMALADLFKIRGLTQDKQQPSKPVKRQFKNSSSYTRGKSAPVKKSRMINHQIYYDDHPEEETVEEESHQNLEAQYQHSDTHSGTKLMGLICPDCRMMFNGVQALKDHMNRDCKGKKIQTLASPSLVSCSICDKKFKNERNLSTHQKKVHKINLSDPESFHFVPTKKQGRLKNTYVEGEEEDDVDYRHTEIMRPINQNAPKPSTSISTEEREDGFIVMKQQPPHRPPSRIIKGQSNKQMYNRKRNMDLHSLGMKFGGQISIISSDNRKRQVSNEGSSKRSSVEVKQEPTDHYSEAEHFQGNYEQENDYEEETYDEQQDHQEENNDCNYESYENEEVEDEEEEDEKQSFNIPQPVRRFATPAEEFDHNEET